MKPWFFGLGTFLALGATWTGCSWKEKKFESVCQVVARRVVETTDDGRPELVDLELEWDPCPGDQFQVVRGSMEFAQCTEKYEVGSMVNVRVKQWWDDRGYYKWDIYQIGDCTREIEPDSEGSYEKSQECSEVKAYGRVQGFECMRRPEKKLVGVCPWMSRK